MRAAGPVDEMTRFPDSILAKQDKLSRWKDNKQALCTARPSTVCSSTVKFAMWGYDSTARSPGITARRDMDDTGRKAYVISQDGQT